MNTTEQALDEIMEEFRMNGKDVDYVELDLDAIDLDRYAPDARSLIIGLLQDSCLDSDMKIIRPPSKTPSYLPTSTVSLMKRQPATRMPMPMTRAMEPMTHHSVPPPNYSLGNGNIAPTLVPTLGTGQGQGQPYPGWSPNSSPTSSLCSSPSYVADLTTSIGQITLADQPNYICTSSGVSSSRPIFGSGLSMKPPLFMYPKQNRFSNYGNRSSAAWNAANAAHFQSFFAGVQPVMSQAMASNTSQESFGTQKLAISPISLGAAEKNINKTMNGKPGNCSDFDCTSEDDMSIDNESADSGNFSGELSLRSDLSSKSSMGDSPVASPSYASVLNTPTSNTSGAGEAVHTFSEGVPDTPKSHHSEGLKPHLWNHKKFVRSSESRSDSRSDGVYDEANRAKECVFCKTNGETPSLYRGHVLKDDQGRTVCHVLQKYVCPLCGATGEKAHTVKYCPKNSNPPAVSMMTTLKSMRSATGNVRMMSNTRRIRSSAKRNQKRTLTGASSYGSA